MFRKVLLWNGIKPFSKKDFMINRRCSNQSVSHKLKGIDLRERLIALSQSRKQQLPESRLHNDNDIPKPEDLDNKQPSTYEDLADVCTPLWRLPYNEQLSLKNRNNLELMERLTTKLKPNRSNNSLVCQLLDTIPSPVEKFYRNKDEYHIRYNHSGEPVVGMCVGKAANGTLECLKSDGLVNMKPIHSESASHFQQYVAQSKWKICEHFKDGGNWRNLIVRSNKENHLMIIAIIHPQDLGQTEIHEEMLRMKDYMLGCPISGNLKSIYYQACPHTRCTAEQSPFVLVHGETHLYEEIGQQRFRISPESFFQINTDGAGVLYDIVGRQLKPNRMSTVLDLCCGTGTQGIMVANKCRGVVGIELSQSAVLDAKFNAQLNGIHNAEFYSGRVETLFRKVLDTLLTTPEISAIINPSRGGTADNVIQLLRENERVRRLVYVSCKPDGPALKNFYMLCQRENKRIKGQPFQLTKATPVDMFPQTNHCELVLTFQR